MFLLIKVRLFKLTQIKCELTVPSRWLYLIKPGALLNSEAAPEHLKQNIIPQEDLNHSAGCTTKYNH